MKSVRDGSSYSAELTYVDAAGAAITPASAYYVVVDEAGTELVARTDLVIAAGATSVSITIAAATNTLTEPGRSLRAIRLFYDHGGQSYLITERYLVEGLTLVLAKNTFQSYEQSLLTAMDLVELTGWAGADEARRTAALKHAYDNLCKLHYVVERKDSLWMSYHLPRITISDMRYVDAPTFEALPDGFVKAIRQAQVVEADVLLGGDAVGERRRDGLMSSSVGEISQMFRPGKPMLLPVSNRALRHLSGYISWGLGTGRA